MYCTFLSWRYLITRRTNVIGIVGIFFGVGALILVLSIMTGFLAESRRSIRGSMSDVLIAPLHLRQPLPPNAEDWAAASRCVFRK